ncbi:MAG: hypothetical protein FWG94_11270 [Oscillospiraceae bacterium]|nr:hypothetical protein [Oscillospiraceae bacterium]
MKKDHKTLAYILIAAGCFLLIAGILFALAVGGALIPVFIISSILLNSIGVTLLKTPRK